MISRSDTIAAISTPPGRGGVGVIRVSGARVFDVVAGLLDRTPEPRVATLARFRGGSGEALDQGLAIVFPAPRSYTGEHVLEIHGHGGPAVQRLLLARCVELGARLAEPGEFTQRAFLNGKLDLAQAEGVADLIDAATATAARAAARSLSGDFSREIQALVQALTELRMFTEATLDFPDEDIDFLRAADARGKLAAIRGRLAHVQARARQGALLRDGLTVVLVGAPNVGKSSLLNQLAGDDIAIVTSIAGTTRDAVTQRHRDPRHPAHGDRHGRLAGHRRSDRNAGHRADVGVAAPRRPGAGAGRRPERRGGSGRRRRSDPRAAAARHCRASSFTTRSTLQDDLPRRNRGRRRVLRSRERHVYLSAKTGAGVELLRREVLAQAGAHEDMEGVYLARARHLAALRDGEARLAAADRQLALAQPPLELFAEELRAAQQALSAITGAFTADDLLGVIFARFCIGK